MKCEENKNVWLRCFLMLMPLASAAQYIPPDEQMPAYRHGLFTNVTPAATVLMAAWPNHPMFTLGYKWQMRPNNRYRVSASYIVTDNYLDENEGIGNLRTLTDSTLIYSFYYDTRFATQLRFGKEWIKNKDASAVFAFDLVAQYKYESQERINQAYARDSTCALCIDFSPEALHYMPATEYETALGYLGLGFSFAAGYRLRWREHWEMQFLFSPEVLYTFPVSEKYSPREYRTSPEENYVNFRLYMLQLHLHYFW